MSSHFSFDNNTIFKDSFFFVKAKYTIIEILPIYQANILIILYNGIEVSDDRNIECYNIDGEFLWKVDAPLAHHERNYYNKIYMIDNELVAYNDNGHQNTLDKRNGEVNKSFLIK